MSFRFKRRVYTINSLTIQHYMVLNGVFYLKSYRDMAKDIGRSPTQVKYLVQDLVELELLERLPVRSGQGNSVRLTLLGERQRSNGYT